MNAIRATFPLLKSKKRKLRIRAFSYRGSYEGYQLLQEKRWWGWKTIDREEVPAHVKISLGCFGDTGGWVSKFHDVGRWGRDGIVHPD